MNTTIRVKCIDQVLTLEHTPVVASGGLNEDFIEFEFCGKWDGFVLTAVFWKNEKDAYHVLLDEANCCQVPPEVTADEGLVYFGVFGVNAEGVQRTSNVLTYHIEKGAITTGTKPSEPTPDIYTQIMQEFQRFETEITQQQTAFEGSMGEAWAAFQTQLSQQQTAFEEALTQQQNDYETNMNQQWSDFKTGGDFVLKTDYEKDMPNKADKEHTHSADDITSGVLPVERGGTGVQSLDKLSGALGVATAPYLALVGNANADMVDAALGKNNEDRVKSVGLALAMYARFKDPTIDIATEFPELIKCDTLSEIAGE